MSYPGILAKSNSEDISGVHSNKSLCQGSGYVLYRQFIYIFVFYNFCTPVAATLSTTNSLFSVVTLYSLQILLLLVLQFIFLFIPLL